jgi:membrane protease YdiL (CAAX protease family)
MIEPPQLNSRLLDRRSTTHVRHKGGSVISRFLWLSGAGVLALVLTTLASGLWAALLLVNLQTSPAVPWAVVAMGVLLWTMWQYAGGRWWPSKTSLARRDFLRANRVSARVFTLALASGACSLVALTGIWIVLFQTGLMRGNRVPDFSHYPTLTVVAVLMMAALVGAFTEEAGFRGYFQVALEREFTAPVAIAIAALALTPGHGVTQGFAWPTVLFYLLVDVMLGVTAYLCNSVWPGIAIHASGLLIFFAFVWPFDSRRPLVGNAGADWWFWLHATQAVVFSMLAALAFRRLSSVAKRSHVDVVV